MNLRELVQSVAEAPPYAAPWERETRELHRLEAPPAGLSRADDEQLLRCASAWRGRGLDFCCSVSTPSRGGPRERVRHEHHRFAPQGAGKSVAADRLARHFRATVVVDEWSPGVPLPEGGLALTNVPGVKGARMLADVLADLDRPRGGK